MTPGGGDDGIDYISPDPLPSGTTAVYRLPTTRTATPGTNSSRPSNND